MWDYIVGVILIVSSLVCLLVMALGSRADRWEVDRWWDDQPDQDNSIR